MYVVATGKAEFKINKTGETITVDSSDLDWDCEGDNGGDMGIELVHTAEYDLNGHIVTWSIWEYPIGAENHDDTEVPPELTMVSNISFHLEHEPE